jgi:hypothetical protein
MINNPAGVPCRLRGERPEADVSPIAQTRKGVVDSMISRCSS